MGQHKNLNRLLPESKFIICTKWIMDNPTGKVSFWTPIGTNEKSIKKQLKRGIPYFYNTFNEANEALTDIVKLKYHSVKNLMFVILEVKYAPIKIKAYNQKWFDKYVIKEEDFKVEPNNTQVFDT